MTYCVSGRGSPRLHDDLEAAVLDAIGRTGAEVRIVEGWLEHNEGPRWVCVGAARDFAAAMLHGETYEGVGMDEIHVH